MWAIWARCRVDEGLHLLVPRAVLQLAAHGCAVAWCGALLLTQELVVRGSGTACRQCLHVMSPQRHSDLRLAAGWTIPPSTTAASGALTVETTLLFDVFGEWLG